MIMRALLVAIIAGITLTAASARAQSPVETQFGAVIGSETVGVEAFLGIPYAAPPVGPLRWRPPQPHPPWDAPRPASEFGPICPQPYREGSSELRRSLPQSEDCLTLNVWRPTGGGAYPVMVWIHGGANRIGSARFPFYDGAELARRGVVVVSLNYRLGLLGYFAHPALSAEPVEEAGLANYGLMDQVQALAWVRTNIARFGGDPDNITVFGESAGGASIVYLMTSERAAGLFHRAIIQSGGGFQNPPTLAEAEQQGLTIAEAVGLGADASAAALRSAPLHALLDVAGGTAGGIRISPIVDGRFLREPPWRAFSYDRVIDVPLLIGANSDDASVLRETGVRPAALAAFAGRELPRMRRLYGGARITDAEFFRQVLNDTQFVAPARWMARRTANGAPSFLYHFSYVREDARQNSPGAAHGSEITLVFGNLRPLEQRSASETRVSEFMMQCWVSFARHGAPQCPIGDRTWPEFRPFSDELVDIADEPSLRPRFRTRQLDFVERRTLEQRRAADRR